MALARDRRNPWRRLRLDAFRVAGLSLLVVVLIVSSVGNVHAQGDVPLVDAASGQVLAAAVHPFDDPGPRRTDGRVPLMEVFTATWCPPCAPADRAIDRIMDEMAPGLAKEEGNESTRAEIDLALLAYHPFPDPEGEDPFGIPEGHARMRTKYDAFWFPTVWVDGHLEDGPTTRSRDVQAGIEEVHYQSYRHLIQEALTVPAVFELVTEWSRQGDNLSVTLHLRAVAGAEGPFLVQGVFWEDHLHHAGLNGIEVHRMTVRAMTNTQVVRSLAPGDEAVLAWDLRIPRNLAFEASGLTFIVETPAESDPGVTPTTLMGFAVGTGTVAALSVFVLRRHERGVRRARQDARGASDEKAPAASPRHGEEGDTHD